MGSIITIKTPIKAVLYPNLENVQPTVFTADFEKAFKMYLDWLPHEHKWRFRRIPERSNTLVNDVLDKDAEVLK